jgi:endonuclease/exonuclease/phosphatase family metal-dependent hydrolase
LTAQTPGELRFLHWNVHSWRDAAGAPNAAQVSAMIKETAPHAVSLVEVNEPWGRPETLASVAEGYQWTFVPSVEFGEEPSRRGYGNALLTRLPVTATQQVSVFAPDQPYDGSEPSETRSAALARVSHEGTQTWLGSTHFPATHRAARKHAARAVLELVRQLSTPWIICGDFNAAPKALFAGRTDLLRVFPEIAEPTFPAHRPRTPIDYFLASPGIAMKTEVLRVTGSDHLPVLGIARLG